MYEGKYPIVSQEAALISGYWDNENEVNKVSRPVVVFGDHTQVVKFVDFDFVVGADGVKVLCPKEQIEPKFLYYYILANPIQSLGYARHFRHLKTLRVWYPPLDEQKRIVSILDQAFEGLDRARANAEANLESSKELLVSLICDAFHSIPKDAFSPVGEVAQSSLGKMLDKNKNQGTLQPYLRNLNVRWFDVDTNDLLEMKFQESELERYSVKAGDLLICEGGYPGRAAIWTNEYSLYYQKALHRVRFEHQAYAVILMYYLYFMDHTKKLQDHFSGTGIQHFTGKALSKFVMPYPQLDIAQQIATKLQKQASMFYAASDAYTAKVEDITKLQQALLQKAFSGELT